MFFLDTANGYGDGHNERLVGRAIADRRDKVILAWLLAQGEDVVPIPGTKRRANLEQNAGACAVSLSPDDLQRLEAVAPKGSWSGARYASAGQGKYGTSRARSGPA